MRIAFFSDIHANLPALEEALASAEHEGASTVIVAGDVVGGGPHPYEVVNLLREREIPVVRGNVDRKVLRVGRSPKALKKAQERKKRRNEVWTAWQLGAGERQWLDDLPLALEVEFNGARVLVVHGSPQRDTDYIYPSITPEGLRSKLGDHRPAVIVSGHSHVPFTRQIDGVQVINCGTVGRPADGDPRGSYALADFSDPDDIQASIVRFTYSVDNVISDLTDREVPRIDPEDYREGVKTD